MALLSQPWPWWLSGIALGLVVPLLYLLGGKWFGISTSFQQLGALCSPHSQLEYFQNHDRRKNMWTLVFVAGVVFGAFLANTRLISPPVNLLPPDSATLVGAAKLLLGGFLVGFGARYAGGCTSGHSITGIANLNPTSVLATACFFSGGLAVTWLTDWVGF
ncbi:MAG: YeeE/YedE family protein [Candidatus Eremiobacteraeota bacterium]|nr:YeeE/YedE family protein [Candidatus Eremiobacteraeota bacterium]